jgi:hypothetical protein
MNLSTLRKTTTTGLQISQEMNLRPTKWIMQKILQPFLEGIVLLAEQQ